MKLKKIIGGGGAILGVLFLLLVAFRIIGWKLFWIGILILAVIAYFVLPRMKES